MTVPRLAKPRGRESTESLRRRGCPSCGASGARFALSRDHFMAAVGGRYEVRYCAGCRLGFIHPMPTVELLDRAYPESYFTPGGEDVSLRGRAREFARRTTLVTELGYPPELLPRSLRRRPTAARLVAAAWRNRESRVPRWSAGGEVLDVGCGPGSFLLEMRELGWSTLGVEPAAAAVAIAKERGLDVIHGTLEDTALEDGRFDAVRMSGVLEHVPDRWGVLAECHRVLRSGGEILINIPNIASFNARLFRGWWHHLDTPRHLTHFEPGSAATALATAGFEDCTVLFSSGYFGTWLSIVARLNEYMNEDGPSPVHSGAFARHRVARPLKLALFPLLGAWATATDLGGRGEIFTIRAIKC